MNTCYIYFIRAGKRGPIKIGVAVNIHRRIIMLQNGNAKELRLIGAIVCDGRKKAFSIENMLHKKFDRYRIRGEWFDPIVSTKLEKYLNY